MTNEDPYGSAKATTEYEAQGKRGARAGKALSGWAVFVAAIFVGTILAWVALHEGVETNPAPGPTDDGIRSGRGAAQN
ncbi:hypothetical protein FHX08_006387 [Rhizobium sp. BK529]|uniref:hypothetical protein n=1 Tax=Rhizobium sp. BK418 TaxID=2512120 RepID=UPI0010486068|nr:hypothetical protein [Rhizobium sp. BK418]MBB3595967.1 hypothetical protein [Rhizobium sp. BK529]TCR96338.1 hypothetical protein EV281_111105 [Rhizobium sp. BK418]